MHADACVGRVDITNIQKGSQGDKVQRGLFCTAITGSEYKCITYPPYQGPLCFLLHLRVSELPHVTLHVSHVVAAALKNFLREVDGGLLQLGQEVARVGGVNLGSVNLRE